ncbi:YdeI/OmpD-associated family protein [Pseudopedobacter beijingensis]|uniref:YdeI/OmpD-associated family protein n=1 Tax=Pseudopedobacter beijingensis TaxID=1207056 RepID=A0ABW4I755_9SPHI
MELSLIKKLKIKSGQKVYLANAPSEFIDFMNGLHKDFELVTTAKDQDVIILFVENSNVLYSSLNQLHIAITTSSLCWICYPKKTSNIKSDLEMMSSWKDLEKYELRPVASIAIDKNWTGLQIKPIDTVKKSGISNESIAQNELGEFIDVKNRIITLPENLDNLLNSFPEEKSFFNTLSYTCKKEYLIWLLTAKQEKTKLSRQTAFIEKLRNQKKSPSEK